MWRVSCPSVAPNQFSLHCSFPQISFWIDNQSIPARTALGITTVLAMTTLLFGVQSSLPSVPYIKAVDLFMIVSFANVFAALVEFAVVNYTSMREKERKESKPSKNTKNKYTVVRKSHSYTTKFTVLSVAWLVSCHTFIAVHVLLGFTTSYMLPCLLVGYMFSRACCWLHVFSRLLLATATSLWLVTDDMSLRQHVLVGHMSPATCSNALCSRILNWVLILICVPIRYLAFCNYSLSAKISM